MTRKKDEDINEDHLPVVIHHVAKNHTSVTEFCERIIKILVAVLAFGLIIGLGIFMFFVAQQLLLFKTGLSDAFFYTTNQFKSNFDFVVQNRESNK